MFVFIYKVMEQLNKDDHRPSGWGQGIRGRGEGRGGERRGGDLKYYRHTPRQTYRPSDEAGPIGAFAPKNFNVTSLARYQNVP